MPPTLAQFGHGSMTIDNQPARGTRPLLLVVVNFQGSPLIARPLSYYDDLVFRQAVTYFREASGGTYTWTRAGAIGPISLPLPAPDSGTAQVQAAIANVLQSGMFNPTPFDTKGDGNVQTSELGFVVVVNTIGDDWAHARLDVGVVISGNVTRKFGTAVRAGHLVSLYTMCHELSHLLGTKDLYANGGNRGISLLGDGGSGVPHLDPWHRMRLGWAEPRIYNMETAGRDFLLPVHHDIPDRPILLYHPSRGVLEFFLLELRTANTPERTIPDRQLVAGGLAIWHVVQAPNFDDLKTGLAYPEHGTPSEQPGWLFCRICKSLFYGPAAGRVGECTSGTGQHEPSPTDSRYTVPLDNAGVPPDRAHWRWCRKCSCLFKTGPALGNVCVDRAAHDPTGSGMYAPRTDEFGIQHGWSWCRRCRVLHWGEQSRSSSCAAGGAHSLQDSGRYSLHTASPGLEIVPPAGTISGFRYCRKCHSLFHDQPGSSSVCPQDHGPHDAVGSNYRLYSEGDRAGQDGWRICMKCAALFHLPDRETGGGFCPSDRGTHSPAPVSKWAVSLLFNNHTNVQRGWLACSRCGVVHFPDARPILCAAGGNHTPLPEQYSLHNIAPYSSVAMLGAPGLWPAFGSLWAEHGMRTPPLTWRNGETTDTRLTVLRSPGAPTEDPWFLQVEWTETS